MITIHYDYTDGTEISYIEGMQKKDNFTTHCLDFFSFYYLGEVSDATSAPLEPRVNTIVLQCKNGDFISVQELLHNEPGYTKKHIRPEHNIHRMLVAGSFTFKKPIQDVTKYSAAAMCKQGKHIFNGNGILLDHCTICGEAQ